MRTTEEPTPCLEILVRNSRCYAGIGSRSTPYLVLLLMSEIAATLADYGLMLRSGAAPGADTAFERGCDRRDGKKEIFLPWQGFNQHPSPFFNPSETAEEIAAYCHPNWRSCKGPARKLHARNCHQVYGAEMNSPVDFVLFWAREENGKVEGGTATAVTLAREMGIPNFNLKDEETRRKWMELVNFNVRRKRFFWKTIFQWLDSRER